MPGLFPDVLPKSPAAAPLVAHRHCSWAEHIRWGRGAAAGDAEQQREGCIRQVELGSLLSFLLRDNTEVSLDDFQVIQQLSAVGP